MRMLIASANKRDHPKKKWPPAKDVRGHFFFFVVSLASALNERKGMKKLKRFKYLLKRTK